MRLSLSPLALALLLCASPALAAENDSLEGVNRPIYSLNDIADRAIGKPIAGLYSELPDPMRQGVTNFFSNLGEVRNALNNYLQGKGHAGTNSLMRLGVNSTAGVGGLFDVATRMGIAHAPEDFGQTLAVWGVGEGSYAVLPILGPSTVRDVFALPVDLATNPLFWLEPDGARYSLVVLNGIDRRARLLGTEEAIEGLTEDRYTLVRNAFLQQRAFEIADGELAIDDYYDE